MTPLKRENAFFQVKSVELGGRQKVANCRQAPCVKIATFGLSWGTPHEPETHTFPCFSPCSFRPLKQGRGDTYAHPRIPAFSFRPLNKGSDDTPKTHTRIEHVISRLKTGVK